MSPLPASLISEMCKGGVMKGTFDGNVKKHINCDVKGKIIGHIFGNINGNMDGEIVGNIFGSISRDVNGKIRGNIMKSGSITGNVNGDIIGNVFGHIARDIKGKFIGDCNGGTIGGDITGEFNGKLNRCKVMGSIKKGIMEINLSQVLGGVCYKWSEATIYSSGNRINLNSHNKVMRQVTVCVISQVDEFIHSI